MTRAAFCVSIMNRTATATAPRPYCKTCATFGAAECTALRTGLNREVIADIHKPRCARHRLIPHMLRDIPVLASAANLPFLAWSQRPDTLPTQMSPKASAIFVVSLCRKSFPVLAILAWIAATRRALFARCAVARSASYPAKTLEFSTFLPIDNTSTFRSYGLQAIELIMSRAGLCPVTP